MACTEVDRTSEITCWPNANTPWTHVGLGGGVSGDVMIVCADIILLVKTVFMHSHCDRLRLTGHKHFKWRKKEIL